MVVVAPLGNLVFTYSRTDIPYYQENRPCHTEQSQDDSSDYWKQAKHLHIHQGT